MILTAAGSGMNFVSPPPSPKCQIEVTAAYDLYIHWFYSFDTNALLKMNTQRAWYHVKSYS